MSKCDITVTMPIEEYERLKENAEWHEKKHKDIYDELHKCFDVNEQGNVTYYDEEGMIEFLKTFIYEVKYDL